MEFRVLGPVEAWHNGDTLHFARQQQRLVLGILALEANTMVSRDQLVELLWGDRAPQRATAVVQSRVSEVRAMLDSTQFRDPQVQLTASRGGYLLRTPPERVDAQRFRDSISRRGEYTSQTQARAMIRTALALWRGPVLGGGLSPYAHAVLCQGLEAARLTAVEDLFDLELHLDNHLAIVDEVVQVAAANPTRERLVAQMLLALSRAGRGAEALQAYNTWQRWLRDELGTDPSPDLTELHVAILRGETPSVTAGSPASSSGTTGSLARPSSATGGPAGTPTSPPDTPPDAIRGPHPETPTGFRLAVPHILPADISDFSGRQREVRELGELLRPAGRGVRVVVVSGPGGAGKTALAVHVAHRLSHEFPDGQLYAMLRTAQSDEPTSAFGVLGRFLRALGVDGLDMPDTLDERVDLYRGLLAGRRLVVVLDNVTNEDQLLPLIPGSSACSVIVTSRTRLGGTLGAQTLPLDVMAEGDALALFSQLAGTGRVTAEPDAAVELVQRCGHLPLAIRVAGAKLGAKPHWSVGKLVSLLRDEHSRLDRLVHGHLDVRASIEVSHRGLDVAARTLLRRIGDIDLPEVEIWIAAALLDSAAAEAEELLEQLLDAQLLDFAGRDAAGSPRYRLHDLVRLFAREKAQTDASPDDLSAARQRVYGATQYLVDRLFEALWGDGSMTMHGGAARWRVPDDLVDMSMEGLLRWFDTSRPLLVPIIERATADMLGETVWDLVCTASPLFPMRRLYDDWQHVLDRALTLTTGLGDRRGEAALRYRLGMLWTDRQDFDRAEREFQHAAALFTQADDPHGRAVVGAYLAMVSRFRRQPGTAVEQYRAALVDLVAYGDHGGAGFVQRGLGQAHMALDELDEAARLFAESRASYQRCGAAPVGRSQLLLWEGMLLLRQGRHERADAQFTEVLEIARTLGDRHGQAQALRGLGLARHRAGRYAEARAALTEALELVRQPRPSIVEAFVRDTMTQLFDAEPQEG